MTTAIDLWKVWRVLCLRRSIADREGEGGTEAATETFDALATRTLGVGVAPMVAGWALYALVSYPHRGWYSWVVGSLADAVYLFGFVMMTPQLFINYKLKSVAHLPWRVLMYKAFNTFIDDAFALMVAMPTAHRVACLRDDAVFLVYMYQRYLYPVDKTRANEYGIAYEREEVEATAEAAPRQLEQPTGPQPTHAEAAGRAESASASILPRIRVVEYGVLGTQLVPGAGIVQRAEPPDDLTAFVDPAGLPYIQRAGPAGAGGASGSIYEHIGIRGDAAFPDDVVAAIRLECEAHYHRYETADGTRHHCIHTVGPMLGYGKHSYAEAVETLAGAYRNVLTQYVAFASSRAAAGLPEGAAVRLRLLPISGGIFAGEYQARIAPLTLAALAAGLELLSDEARAVLERDEGAPQIELCVFLASELEAFRAAMAHALRGVPQTAA